MMSFVSFCDFLGVTLEPGQRELVRVAFDGEQPEGRLGELIFGSLEPIPQSARGVLCAVCGARSGKTYVLGALRLLHQSLTTPLETLAPGEQAIGLIVAPDMRLARQALSYVKGACRMRKQLSALVVAETADSITLRRPEGGVVAIECLPATAGGGAVRGRSLVGALLDEAAFFRDDSYKVNDAEIFKAVHPRMLPGAQLVIASTPWVKKGLLYELYRGNYGKHQTAVAAHAPTLLLRDVPLTREIVERERQLDPDNARREFDAEFMDLDAQAFFDSRAIERSVDPKLVLPLSYDPDACTAVGSDFAFRHDSSALVAVARDRALYRVANVLELRPTEGPLVPSAVVGVFARIARGYQCEGVVADSHYRESISEHLDQHDLLLFSAPEGVTGKNSTFTKFRTLLHGGKFRLPEHTRLIRQLREVQAKPTAGGQISIQSPRWKTGGHGDLVSALVLATDYCHKHVFPDIPAALPQAGSVEFYQRQSEIRKERKIKRAKEAQDWDEYLQECDWHET
jgi:hypothetical protein